MRGHSRTLGEMMCCRNFVVDMGGNAKGPLLLILNGSPGYSIPGFCSQGGSLKTTVHCIALHSQYMTLHGVRLGSGLELELELRRDMT